MSTSFKRNVLVGFGFSLLLLIVSSLASYISIRNLLSSAELVETTNARIQALEQINRLLLEAESGQRGYLLVNDPALLRPLRDNLTQIRSELTEMKELLIANGNQQQLANVNELEDTIEVRIETLNQGVRLKEQGQFPDSALLAQGNRFMESARKILLRIEQLEEEKLVQRTQRMQRFSDYTPVLIVAAALIALLITIVFYTRIIRDFRSRAALHEELRLKNIETDRRLSIIQDIANRISAGDFTAKVSDEGHDLLGNLAVILNKMGASLEESFRKVSAKEWLQSGIVGLNNKMLGEQHLDVLAHHILRFVADYTDSCVGALYLVNSSDNLILSGKFALSNKVPAKLNLGEGVVGQCALQKKMIRLDDISAEDFSVSLAVGNLKPSAVVAIPLLHEGKVKGVMELGTLKTYDDNHIHFFDSLSWQTGIVINSAQSHWRLQELLEETQAQSEELQSQHTELENINEELKSQSQKLQVSEEELRAQQEELMHINTELEERSTLLEERNHLIEDRNREIQVKAGELAESTRYKSEFLANMSHELRTPLNSILLLSRLMTENNQQNLSADQIEYARVIQSSGQGLLILIDDILDLSKIEAGKMEVNYEQTSVQEILNDIRSLFSAVANEKGLELGINAADNVPRQFETDRIRVTQILRNLISNAMKFTEQGYVRLQVSVARERSGMLVFSVKDTGVGIPSEKQQLIFEAFRQADGSTRREYGGTGLGLSISRELAHLLGGELELESEPGKGSDFRLIIPVARPGGGGAADHTAPAPQAGGQQPDDRPVKLHSSPPGNVLITEDNTPDKMSRVLHRIEDVLSKEPKKVLIVEENTKHARALSYFLENFDIDAGILQNVEDSVAALLAREQVCVILDISAAGNGDLYGVLEKVKATQGLELLPVIVFTGKHLSKTEESRLKQYAHSIVLKTAHSYQRILDEVSLFLHLAGNISRKAGSAYHMGSISEVLRDKEVLIADDDVRNIFSLSKVLEGAGMKVISATDGGEALQQLKDHPAVDVILMDMMMPEMDGYEAMRRIRMMAGFSKIPIIAVTARAMVGDREKCVKAGASDYITKPIDKDQLLSLLRVWLYDRN